MNLNTREELLKEYPFLQPYELNPEYISVTEGLMIDSIPAGWNEFILDMCKEVKQVLVENDFLDSYELYQVKEKYGSLRWYDNTDITREVIEKYESISANTCVACGDKATRHSKGWIMPLCEKCYEEYIAGSSRG